MKYCPNCARIFEDNIKTCSECKKALVKNAGLSDPVCIISADGFERERIVAALKDNGVPCTEKLQKKERSADIVTGVNSAKVDILVPFAAYDNARDILIGIGAIKIDEEQIIDENSEAAEAEPEKDGKKHIALKIITCILVVAVACTVIWGLDYIIYFVQQLFGWTNTTNVNL